MPPMRVDTRVRAWTEGLLMPLSSQPPGAGVHRVARPGGLPRAGDAVHSSVGGPLPLLRRARAPEWDLADPRRGVAQLARAPVSKTGCRRFDSCHPCKTRRAHRHSRGTSMSDSAGTATGLGTPDRPERAGRERRPGRLRRAVAYYRQVVAELRKVICPTRRELLTYTSVVLVFVVFMVAVISVYDFAFSQGVLKVFGDG